MSDPKPPVPPAQAAPERSIDEIIAGKRQKLAEIRARGVDPFPARTKRAHTCAEAFAAAQPLEVGTVGAGAYDVAGRLVELRDMGKSIFGRMADQTGRIQVFFKKDNLPEEQFALIKRDVHVGDFVSVSGAPMKTKTGEPTLSVSAVTMLAKALRPMPEKWHGLKDVETRFRHRHLDLIATPNVLQSFVNRSKIISTIRRTLDSRGYVEVETPILLPQAGGASARPFETHHNALGADMVLRIATELYLKRLIIGGFDKVYEIGRIFRNEGIDTRHNPEFTMLEAYEAYSDYEGMAKLFEDVVWNCAQAIGVEKTTFFGKEISLKPPFKRIYLPEAWKDKVGEPIDNVLQGKGFNRSRLLDLAGRLGIHAGDKTPSAKVFERIFDDKIAPLLDDTTFVFDHPTAITPLAKLKAGGDSIVERFECYAAGQELCNAYSELNDPDDQRDRLKEQAKQRAEGDAEADILDEDFVQAMEAGMPPMGGIGIGIDRLVMLLTGQSSIREVILFPTLKPEEGRE